MINLCVNQARLLVVTVASTLTCATGAFAITSNLVNQDISVQKLACHFIPTSSSCKRGKPCVLIACGSFNPPTLMHLRMFEAARDQLRQEGYDVQGGYLSPVHDEYGKSGLLPCKTRLQLVRAAVESSDWLMVDDWEANQAQYSRTLPVLKSVQTRLCHALQLSVEDDMAPRVMLLCGEDLLQSFCRAGVWKENDIPAIFNEHGVVCVARPNSGGTPLVLNEDGPLRKYRHKFVLVEDVVDSSLSSTAVRKAAKEGRSVRYLVPDPVADIIETEGLYGKS
eukprot:jgi/Ulvmu1/3109/UM015_0149.1